MRFFMPTLLALATTTLALPVINDVFHLEGSSTAWKRDAIPQGCDDPINRRDPMCAWKRETEALEKRKCPGDNDKRDPACIWKRDSETEEVESGPAWKRQSCTGPMDERDVELCARKRELETRQGCTGPMDERDVELCARKRELETRQGCTGPIDERDVEMCAWKREADARDMPKSW